MEEDLTDEELRELTRRKREAIRQGLWKPGKVEDLVGDVLKEDHEEWKRAREKSRRYAKRRKAREEREKQRRARGRGKGKNRRELPKEKYTIIEDEFLEAAYKQYFRPNEIKVLLFLIRKTWGWGKRSDFISLNQFVRELGILKPNVRRALSSLVKRRIVEQLRNKMYGIQTDTSLWRDKPKKKKKE
jgi:phage replication O-like protein O